MARYEILNPAQHGQLRFSTPKDYGFAAHLEWIEVLHSEWNQVALQHPIVFAKSSGGDFRSMAVLATGPILADSLTVNSWVDAQGRWKGQVVPGVLKLHPFAITSAEGETAVCVDTFSAALSTRKGAALFSQEGVPSGALRDVMEVLQLWQRQSTATQILLRSLDRLGLLVPLQVEQSTSQWGHAWQVDPQLFEALSSASLLVLRREGWLKPIYAHLLSLAKFQRVSTSSMDAVTGPNL